MQQTPRKRRTPVSGYAMWLIYLLVLLALGLTLLVAGALGTPPPSPIWAANLWLAAL